MEIILWDFLMFYQIFLSPQVKRSAIISNEQSVYELPDKLLNDLRLFYIYFSGILATGAEQLFCWTPPSPLVVKIIKIHVEIHIKTHIVNKASDLHPTTLIKIELFHRYFSRILATGAKQLFCWTSPSGCLRKS